ncbi:helix-turn-helix domain-containing protein [Aquibacillus albus]|uniref:Excisionase family DNA binding protein n=1 Tax=Aquibacillus albus TaxID=1168171 RepID=A0ABS2N0D5_9BACI|nr:helix-turn-helix domain-containing protein [Aquibacillus albus]MBM7571572.1 excisionase family DNA binding protein [Aquibacillus albus]
MNHRSRNGYDLVLTATEIAEILNISKPTAYSLMDSPHFPLIKIGGCKRVLRDDFFQWLSNQTLGKSNLL